jgi:hypothetical protein
VPRRSFTCSHCGATVPARALACPECGSDAETGWSEEAESFAGEIPTGYDEDPDFDYEEALREAQLAADGRPSRAQRRRRRLLAVTLLLLLIALVFAFWR